MIHKQYLQETGGKRLRFSQDERVLSCLTGTFLLDSKCTKAALITCVSIFTIFMMVTVRMTPGRATFPVCPCPIRTLKLARPAISKRTSDSFLTLVSSKKKLHLVEPNDSTRDCFQGFAVESLAPEQVDCSVVYENSFFSACLKVGIDRGLICAKKKKKHVLLCRLPKTEELSKLQCRETRQHR